MHVACRELIRLSLSNFAIACEILAGGCPRLVSGFAPDNFTAGLTLIFNMQSRWTRSILTRTAAVAQHDASQQRDSRRLAKVKQGHYPVAKP